MNEEELVSEAKSTQHSGRLLPRKAIRDVKKVTLKEHLSLQWTRV